MSCQLIILIILIRYFSYQCVVFNVQSVSYWYLVEITRFELVTPCLQGKCSPNWAIPPFIRNLYNLVCILYTMGLNGLEPSTSRLSGVRSNQLSYNPLSVFFFLIWQPPTFPHRFQCSIIGRISLNHRVRDGNGCFPYAHRHQKFSVFSFSVLRQPAYLTTAFSLCQELFEY